MRQIDALNLKIQKFIDVLLCIASIVMLAGELGTGYFSLYFSCQHSLVGGIEHLLICMDYFLLPVCSMPGTE